MNAYQPNGDLEEKLRESLKLVRLPRPHQNAVCQCGHLYSAHEQTPFKAARACKRLHCACVCFKERSLTEEAEWALATVADARHDIRRLEMRLPLDSDLRLALEEARGEIERIEERLSVAVKAEVLP